MRYADGPSVEVEVRIAAPPAQVWPLVCDVDLPGRFSDEFQGAVWLDGASAPSVGARFKGRNHHPAIGDWETISIITECEPDKLLAWAVSDINRPASSWRFELDGDDDGTRLRQAARLGPGHSGTSFEIKMNPEDEEQIIERRLGEHRINMRRTIEGLKELAESGGK